MPHQWNFHKEVNELDYRNLFATHPQLEVPEPMVFTDIYSYWYSDTVALFFLGRNQYSYWYYVAYDDLTVALFTVV